MIKLARTFLFLTALCWSTLAVAYAKRPLRIWINGTKFETRTDFDVNGLVSLRIVEVALGARPGESEGMPVACEFTDRMWNTHFKFRHRPGQLYVITITQVQLTTGGERDYRNPIRTEQIESSDPMPL